MSPYVVCFSSNIIKNQNSNLWRTFSRHWVFFFLVDVFCLFWGFFLIRRNTDVGRNETDPGKTNIHLRGFMDTECFRAVFSKYELIHSPEVLDSK